MLKLILLQFNSGEATENLLTSRTDAPPPAIMRRTASLDAHLNKAYLKGQWPRGTADKRSCLLVEKGTQTEEWQTEDWQEDKRSIEFVFISQVFGACC